METYGNAGTERVLATRLWSDVTADDPLRAKVQAVRSLHPHWPFDLCWSQAARENPELFNRPRDVVNANQEHLQEKMRREGNPGKPRDPRVTEALNSLQALEDDKSDLGIQRFVKFVAEIKNLLSRDTSMTYDQAMCRVIREHPELLQAK